MLKSIAFAIILAITGLAVDAARAQTTEADIKLYAEKLAKAHKALLDAAISGDKAKRDALTAQIQDDERTLSHLVEVRDRAIIYKDPKVVAAWDMFNAAMRAFDAARLADAPGMAQQLQALLEAVNWSAARMFTTEMEVRDAIRQQIVQQTLDELDGKPKTEATVETNVVQPSLPAAEVLPPKKPAGQKQGAQPKQATKTARTTPSRAQKKTSRSGAGIATRQITQTPQRWESGAGGGGH